MGLLADGIPSGLAGGGWWDTEPDIPRVATGIKGRRRKLMALGNAIVPQLGYEILKLTLNTNNTQ
jgi:DNA (cytosine-5)-methyltransferase 1